MEKTSGSKFRTTTVDFGFEAKLWLAADNRRHNLDAAERKQAVIILLKYISDTLESHFVKLAGQLLCIPPSSGRYWTVQKTNPLANAAPFPSAISILPHEHE